MPGCIPPLFCVGAGSRNKLKNSIIGLVLSGGNPFHIGLAAQCKRCFSITFHIPGLISAALVDILSLFYLHLPGVQFPGDISFGIFHGNVCGNTPIPSHVHWRHMQVFYLGLSIVQKVNCCPCTLA